MDLERKVTHAVGQGPRCVAEPPSGDVLIRTGNARYGRAGH